MADDGDVGRDFTARGAGRARFRCTASGEGRVAAIRVDRIEVAGAKPYTLDEGAAEAAGLLTGPPYGVETCVFWRDEVSWCAMRIQAFRDGVGEA